MDTLRWILLAIGILVLAGIYLYGKRSEWSSRRLPGSRGGHDPRLDTEYDELGLHRNDGAGEHDWVDDVRPVNRAVEESEPALSAPPPARKPSPDPLRSKHADQPPAPPAADPLLADDGWVDDVRVVSQDEPASDAPEAAPRHPGEAKFESSRKQRHIEPEPGAPEELLIIHVVADRAVGTFGGEDIATAFEACDLTFGSMQIYHRAAAAGEPLFSAVNMVKPGTFDPEHFSTLQTPGISLFMQLPGPEQPMLAFRTMSDCARRIAEYLGGRLEDETHSTFTTQTLSHYEERVRAFIQHQARYGGGGRR